jgi:hypothetical protein
VYPIDAMEIELGFAVLIDDGGRPSWVSPPFGLRRGEVTLGELPKRPIHPDDRELLVVAVTMDDVARRAPEIDSGRIAMSELLFQAAGEDVYRSGLAGETLDIPLPETATVYRAPIGDPLVRGPAPADVTLVVPIAPEACRSTSGELVPFARQARAVEGGVPNDNFVQVEHVDPDHVLALSNGALHLVRRGETFVPAATTTTAPGNRVGSEAVVPPHSFARFYLDRSAKKVWLAGNDAGDRGLLLGIAVGDDLAIETVAHHPGFAFGAIAGDASGAPVLADLSGGIWRYTDRFEPHSRLDVGAFGEDVVQMIGTGDPATPLLATTTGKIHSYDAASSAWRVEFVARSLLPAITEHPEYLGYGSAASRFGGELELWVVGSDNVILRRLGRRPWELVPIRYPPRFEGCAASGDYPGLADNGGLDGIAVAKDRIFVSIRECTGILEIARDGCVALATIRGDPAVYSGRDLQAINLLAGSLAVAGEGGVVYSSFTEE